MSQIKPLAPELQKTAIVELGEIPLRIDEYLQTLREWLKQQPHLKACNDDQILIQSLRVSKYSVESAKQRLDVWFSYPTKYTIEDVGERTFRQFCNTGSVLPLPMPLNDTSSRIIVVRLNFSIQDFSADDFMQNFLAVHSVMMIEDPYACINGCIYLCDYANVTPNHLLQFNIKFFKTVFLPAIKSAPFRIRGICVINLPIYADYLLKFALKFMPEKLRKRHYFSLKSLQQLVPQKYFPQEYGGDNGSLEQLSSHQVKVFDEHREFLQRLYSYRSDERLRHGKSPFDLDDILGVAGSFRQLNVD